MHWDRHCEPDCIIGVSKLACGPMRGRIHSMVYGYMNNVSDNLTDLSCEVPVMMRLQQMSSSWPRCLGACEFVCPSISKFVSTTTSDRRQGCRALQRNADLACSSMICRYTATPTTTAKTQTRLMNQLNPPIIRLDVGKETCCIFSNLSCLQPPERL